MSFGERCCGRTDPSWNGVKWAIKQNKERNERTYCTHEFFLVRIDRETGEVDHIPNLDGPYCLAQVHIDASEWREGQPK